MQGKQDYKKILFSVMFILETCFSYSQFFERTTLPDTNFFDIVNNFRSRLQGEDTINSEGLYARYKQWESFWAPRLFPTGSFQVAGNAMKNFYANPTTNSSYVANWTELGPYTMDGGIGRINRLAFDPGFDGITNQTMYAGAVDGGVWKSVNGGQNWVVLNTDQLASLNVSSLVVDPHLNSQGKYNIFIGTGDGASVLTAGIYRSQDDGLTWATVNSGLPPTFPFSLNSVGQFAINPLATGNGEMFAATSVGLYHTTSSDAACTWNLVATPGNPYLRNVVYHPNYSLANQVIYASGKDIFKSTDDGNTWNSMTGSGTGLDFVNDPQFSGHIVEGINIVVTPAPGANDYVYANIITLGPNPNPNCQSCFASKCNHYYWFYYFDGVSWNQGNTTNITSCTGAVPDRMCIAVSPDDKNKIYFGLDDIWESTNQGQTFLCRGGYCGNIHPDMQDFQFSPNEKLLYAATDGGVFKRTISNTWIPINNGLAVGRVENLGASPTNTDLILIGKFDEGSYLLDDFLPLGQKWKFLGTCDGMEAIIADNNIDMFTSCQKGSIVHRQYNPITHSFSSANSIGKPNWAWDSGFNTPYVLERSENKIYAGYNDLGENLNFNTSTWAAKSGIQGVLQTCGPIQTFAIAPSDKNFIYVATSYTWYFIQNPPDPYDCTIPEPSRLFKTTQGGGTAVGDWIELFPPNPLAITSIVIHPDNSEKIWITYSGYVTDKVKMYDGTSSTWIDYSNGIPPQLPVNTIVYEKGSNDGLYIGTDVGVYYTNKDLYLTQGWVPFKDGLANAIVKELEINYMANKIRAATFGRGLWESDLACPSNFNLNYTTANSSNLSNTFQEAENDITLTANAGNINVSNLTARAGNEIIISATGTNEVIIVPNSYLFIHGCNHSGNSFRQQNNDSRGNAAPYSSSIASSNNKEEKTIYENVNVKYAFYPNPFAEHLHIDFLLEQRSDVLISVYNPQGQLIEVLAKGKYEAGEHTLVFDNPSIKQGIYFVHLNIDDKNYTRAVIKTK